MAPGLDPGIAAARAGKRDVRVLVEGTTIETALSVGSVRPTRDTCSDNFLRRRCLGCGLREH